MIGGRYYIKAYTDVRRCAAARANLEWLCTLDADVILPTLHDADCHRLVFEHLGHRRPGPEHLDMLADTLGRLHAAAHTQLCTARLDQPFVTSSGLVITDFITPRSSVLKHTELPALTWPVALYKDANIRNFLLTDDGPAIVDFDDLTLAPFGYDLAKLVVSAAMTHGTVPERTALQALNIYNERTASTGADTNCPPSRMRMFAEIHHVLTARYMNRNGYAHAWPDVRPWSSPGQAQGLP